MYIIIIIGTPTEEQSHVLMSHNTYASMSVKINFLVVYWIVFKCYAHIRNTNL